AVEAGVRVTEAEDNLSVGYGGLPDREGKVTLDACIMDEKGECGAVAFLEDIKHPVSVARMVMEKTPHVMLVGEGAKQFALAQGFKEENLLTERAEKLWKEWLVEANYKPIINIENHDTIGMLALDEAGNLSGACTTSGLAYKMRGRVGDSPIIGAGLYVDNEVGAATATGMGEAIIKICGAHLIVELMRQGYSPQEACEVAIKRIARQKNSRDIQIGFLALGKNGEVGSYSLHQGFDYARYAADGNKMTDVGSFYR
ncbi:MAG: isoaspartyl peptidase/L-asparaginase family protein, partial [Cyclobacteriaceae bacterium]